ncbi:MAG: Na+/H+ antiporter NhaC family protein [Ilumatobacteraceae bacterium]
MRRGFHIGSGIGEIDRLLSRGGMDSMLPTLWLIMGAVTFGMVLEEFGLISRPKYASYAVFCWASPLLSIASGSTGFRIIRSEPEIDSGLGDEEAEPVWAIEPTSP